MHCYKQLQFLFLVCDTVHSLRSEVWGKNEAECIGQAETIDSLGG